MTPPRLVPGTGPLTAKIAIVGEAPGADEERLGEPFVGASGRFLTLMLMTAGISRRACYVTNVVKRRPPGNDFEKEFYLDGSKANPVMPTAELVAAWSALALELAVQRVDVVIALGEQALRALTGKRGITKWRGSVLEGSGVWVVATYHPASVLRKYEQRVIVEHDFRRARGLTTERYSPPVHDFVTRPTLTQALEYLQRFQPGTKCSFDIETLGARVRCIALAPSGREAISVPFAACARDCGLFPTATGTQVVMPGEASYGSYWDLDAERAVVLELARILGDPRIPLIAQNFPFDAGFMEREFGIVCQGLEIDTMVAQHCCYSELPKGLDFLCSFYTHVPYYSDYDASNDQSTWTYNCYDAAVTFEVAEALGREMKELGV